MDILQNGNCCQCIYSSIDNEKVLEKYGILAQLYAYLKQRFELSRILLFRNLSYINKYRKSYKTIKRNGKNLNEICEYLRNRNIPKSIKIKPMNINVVYTLRIDGFYDGDSECEWETVQATASVIVVHHWKDKRKSKIGKKSTEILSNISFNCNNKQFPVTDSIQMFNFNKNQLFADTSHIRICYSYLLFKIKAFERKKRSQYIFSQISGKLEECSRVYPVNYEARCPIYKHDYEDSTDNLVDGKYELRLDVADEQPMECTTNMINGTINHINTKQSSSLTNNNNTEDEVNKKESNFDSSMECDDNDNYYDNFDGVNNSNNEDDDDYEDGSSGDDDDDDKSKLLKWVDYDNEMNEKLPNMTNKIKEYSKWPRIKFIISSCLEDIKEKDECENGLINQINGDCDIIKTCNGIDNNNINNNNKNNNNNNENENNGCIESETNQIMEVINGIIQSFDEDLKETDKSKLSKTNHKIVKQNHSCSNPRSSQRNKSQDLLKPLSIDTNITHLNIKTPLICVYYKFMNKDKIIQWTHSESFECPFCHFERIKTLHIHFGIQCLLKHLRTFHARISFQCYTSSTSPPITNGIINSINNLSYIIEVRLNDSFDGSVEIGLRHAQNSNRPQRRQLYTQLIYSKYVFNSVIDKIQGACADLKPVSRGHNRDYFHSATGMLQTVTDMDEDSENDDIPIWLKHQYHKRLEEFMDVNPGEKRVMQLWNEHLLQHKYHGDYALPILIERFIEKQGLVMKQENLRNNLILHLLNLVDYGLLSTNQFVETMNSYDLL